MGRDLVFLAHRLPYPPNKGDKVRSYHLLRHLSQRYDVHLGTFIDDPADREHLPRVRALCADMHVEHIVPQRRRLMSAVGLLRGEALSVPYYRTRALRGWMRRVVRRTGARCAVSFSSPMAQYVPPGLRSVVDMVDVDSAKWTEYARSKSWPASSVYRREGERLLAYEREIARRADAVTFVTDREASLFRASAPDSPARIVTIRNGVDHEFFSPELACANPYRAGELPIVFTGAMDYWPNVDAAVWFAGEVLPLLRAQDPAVVFYVVGMNPDPAVRALASSTGVVVTGRVDDIRPYLRHARVVVAPLRVARGIQNKVLEAMAMQKAVVTTPASAGGLELVSTDEIAVASTVDEFVRAVLSLRDPDIAAGIGRRARARVVADFNWERNFEAFDELIDARARHDPAPTRQPVGAAQPG